MRLLLGLAATLFLASAAQAQNTSSDSYLCNHGDQSDVATQQACARLRGGESAGPPAGKPQNPGAGQAQTTPPAPSPAQPPAAAPAAPPPPTDVGEAPVNETAAATANSEGSDEDSTHISVDSSWLSFLGPLAIFAIIFGCFAGMAFYFLPTIIALVRQKRNTIAIFVLNFFLGWTFIGWVVALVWSLSTEPGPLG